MATTYFVNPLSKSIAGLNAVAMGDKKADMLLKNCTIVSVYTNEIIAKQNIAIYQDRIAYVGPDASHATGNKTHVIDIGGRYVTPGFADPHIHIDQFVSPQELAKRLLLCGTTTLFSDPIDTVSVAGYRGLRELVRITDELPLRVYHVVPGGLPVDEKFSRAASITHTQERSATRHPSILGMGEVFSWTRVTARDPETMKSLSGMLESGCIINGHTAGASGRKLNAYISSGIFSCHEPVNFDQVLERLRLGMWVMMREGSIRRDLKNIIPGLLSHDARFDRLMFCSDGLDPVDIEAFGHMDHCIREAVSFGVDPRDAITMASRNCFEYYGMSKDLGGIAPGKLADILVFDDLESVRPDSVIIGGKLAVLNKKLVARFPRQKTSPWTNKTVRLEKFSKADFEIRTKEPSVSVNTIKMQTEIITGLGSAELETINGNIAASRDKDVWKVGAFDRIGRTNKHALGFLENLGADIGAFASTWSYHENDLIVIGSNESDMAAAANALVKSHGGIIIVRDGKTISSMPLQFCGILSTDSFDRVSSRFSSITSTMTDSGCRFKRPHMIPLFLPCLALPSIRILHSGIIDVKKRSRVPVIK